MRPTIAWVLVICGGTAFCLSIVTMLMIQRRQRFDAYIADRSTRSAQRSSTEPPAR